MKATAARKRETFELDETHNTVAHGQHQDPFDELVTRASMGDRQAVGAIAVAFGPTLLQEARTALGELDQEAEDVVQDFFLCLLERRVRSTPARGRAMTWMFGVIHAIARQYGAEQERDWGMDAEDE